MTVEIIDHTKLGDGMTEARARELLGTEGTCFVVRDEDGGKHQYLVLAPGEPGRDTHFCLSRWRRDFWGDRDDLLDDWRAGRLTFHRAELHLYPYEEDKA